MTAGFNDRAKQVLRLAEDEARGHNQDYIGTEHILLGLIDQGEGIATKTLQALGTTLYAVRQAVEAMISQGRNRSLGKIPFSHQADMVLELSQREAVQHGHRAVGTEHILLGLLQVEVGIAAHVLLRLGVTLPLTREQVTQFHDGRRGGDRTRPRSPADFEWRRPAEETLAARVRPAVLDRFGRNLTQQAREGNLYPAVGRDKEIDEVAQVLSRQTRVSPLLIGDVAGTTTILDGLAQRIVSGKVPQELRSSQLYYCDARKIAEEIEADGVSEIGLRNRVIELIATLDRSKNNEYRWPQKVGRLEVLTAILQEAQAHDYIILILGNLATTEASPLLQGMLASDSLRTICVASHDDYRQYVWDVTRFRMIQVAEPTTAYAIGKLRIALRAIIQERTANHSI